ncbi:asparagine synthase (glutamine-hydrolyzing) [Methanolobus psychrotolerans]|uniref:asparagine synthase (glutamine-hydrolyzing) n=1 Tax=Methanolobus psychrotolerans TaxID=1874706 RepID=UPI000B91D15C|nr:asparagine synthase (glutamine-hydrolyzing) [Methanolobus psychrotolerans]
MCGICGVFGLNDMSLIRRMSDQLVHRGPDDYGFYSDEFVMLGHRRLSIIDLSSGKQPIHNEDESIWITFNGEIYNYLPLRAELETKGHEFYTSTDTEVIVHLYEEYGEEFISRLRGDFAFCIWDSNSKKILLARDRLGIKPLYYLLTNGVLLFASEIKSILQYEEYTPRVDPNALHNFFMYVYNNSLQTLFQDIKKVPPGSYMVFQGGELQIKSYWDVRIDESATTDEEEYSRRLRELLDEAVEMQLMSDVPLGAYLSGGLDSSSVVGLMSQFVDAPKTFSVGFGDYGESELKYARIVSEHFGTDHHEIIVEPDSVNLLPKIIWHLDEPMADMATIPVYVMSGEAKKIVSVVLAGDGNDEIWAGYSNHYIYSKLKKVQNSIPNPLRKVMLPVSRVLIPPASELASAFVKDPLTKARFHYNGELVEHLLEGGNEFIYKTCYPLSHVDINEVYSDDFLKNVESPEQGREVSRRFMEQKHDVLNNLLLMDVKTILPDSYLVKVDRMTMAQGIEARVPLIDYKLVDFSFMVHPKLKLNGSTEKYLFKKAMKGLLPEVTVARKKRGFGVPTDRWAEELKDVFEPLLLSHSLEKRGYFRKEFLIKAVASLKNIDPYQTRVAWNLATLEMWHRIFEDGGLHMDIETILHGWD